MQINLFTNNAERNRVNKSSFLSNRFALDGYLKKQTSVKNLVIEIEKSEITPHLYNYMFVPSFNRYYFIDDIISIANNRWEIRASVDVLFSFMSEIYNTEAIIEKIEDENGANMYLDDGSFVMDTRKYNDIKEFPNGFNENGSYILICAGGV